MPQLNCLSLVNSNTNVCYFNSCTLGKAHFNNITNTDISLATPLEPLQQT